MDRREDEERVVPLAAATPDTPLVYSVEIWDLPKLRPERVIARAASIVLARAIFKAAESEHLGRRIVLRRGKKVVAQSG
jgi:hypothetical protein